MALLRAPAVVWKDPGGMYTATLVEDDSGQAAVGSSAAEALSALQDWCVWTVKHQPWAFSAPEMQRPRLAWFQVSVRPEYVLRKRRFPVEESVTLPVPVVLGDLPAGLTLCAAPTLNLRFTCHEDEQVKELVAHYVRERVSGLSPASVSRLWPPTHLELADISVRLPSPGPKRTRAKVLEALPLVAEPVTRQRGRLSPRAFGREAEIADLVKRLQADRANVLLVGESGSGKTTMLLQAAREIERSVRRDPERDPDQAPLSPMFWQTSGSRMIAGMRYLGQWEERCEKVVSELAEMDGILCADSLIELLRVGGFDATDSVAAFLMPFLQHRELRMVTECSQAELDAARRLLPGFVENFQILSLASPAGQAAIAMLDQLARADRQNLRIEFEEALPAVVYRMHRRFLPQAAFPGKAAGFLHLLFERAATAHKPRLSLADALEAFVADTGLPELFLRDELPLDEAEIRAELELSVIGQAGAVRAAATLLTTFKAGLNDPQRPLGVLLFSGPTGVGKTELAKAVSRYLFGHGQGKDRLIRLDMSEYGQSGSAERIFSGPQGEPSELIRRLRAQPFCVLLLDEIEKASPDVYDVFMSAFDEGRLTDRFGRTTSLQSAIIIMTSNLGAGKGQVLGFGEGTEPDYEAEAMAWFRPEFFNRLDAVVSFKPLSQDVVLEIASKELQELSAREGMQRAGIRLEFSRTLVEQVAKAGFDARFGARPLQRTIESLVVAPLARYLVRHKPRASTLRLGWRDGSLSVVQA